uniref:Small ribosomal subunit protein uS11c n=1 Tax=Boodleopsis pusilla TaxID=381415 RepID=A0A386AZH4_9CHLO|nr:ribosomal protein S11 [Boodleopsis pusilla]AYC64846.1 ribosomal protein S11 [Boodleopsis pusilla]
MKTSFQRTQWLTCQASAEAQKKRESKPQVSVFKDSPNVIIHIKISFNNTLFTLTNFQGQVLTWTSAGSCGFKGARKGTPFAAKKVVEIFVKKSHDFLVRCQQIKICVCGVGPGRENALRGLGRALNDIFKQEKRKTKKKNNKITLIREVTKLPHNGCRPPKKRRL